MSEPFVSVMMPIRNEEAFIERSLGAVLSQDYPPERIEVLIADGMSDDRTLDEIRACDRDGRVRVIANPKRIQSAGLNLLIPQARGDYLIRVDGHTIIAPDYVRTCVRLLQETGADNVGGAMNPIGTTTMGKAIAAVGKSAFAVPTAFHVSEKAQYTDTVYLGAWPRHVFERVSGYSEHFAVNEDYELNYRIRASGGKIFFSRQIRSEYYGRQTLRALARQYYRYGRSKVKTLRQHPGSLRPRQIIAPIFVAGLILGGLAALVFPPLGVLWLSGITIYTFVNLYFSTKLAGTAGWSSIWRFPIIFLTIHLAWGSGFWVELLALSGRVRD